MKKLLTEKLANLWHKL